MMKIESLNNDPKNRLFNVVLAIGPNHTFIAHKSIQSLIKYACIDKIFIITSKNFFNQFNNFDVSIRLIDEDKLIPKLQLNDIETFLAKMDAKQERAGWYFQQFLKMAISNHTEIGDHYLIWDSDTIMLKPITFFSSDDRVYIKPSNEHHKPYFSTFEKISGLEKTTDYSFISEHLMINTQYMKELISQISLNGKSKDMWYWDIMNSIENCDLSWSGFSEYESYGNFIAHNYPNSFKIRPLSSTREGSGRFGMRPNKYDLQWLSNKYQYATFESYGACESKLRIFRKKLWSFISYFLFNFLQYPGE